MKTTTSKITIHMVCSLDGFIAKKDGTVDWLRSTDNYEPGVTLSDEDIAKFLDGIDCYVMGAHTYEHALELGWPYGDAPVIVLSHRDLKADRANVSFHSGDLINIVNNHIKPKYQNIWMVGGAATTKDFIRLGLVDELVISIMPVILGEGLLFFDYIGQEHKLHLKDSTTYKDGMVELTYDVIKD